MNIAALIAAAITLTGGSATGYATVQQLSDWATEQSMQAELLDVANYVTIEYALNPNLDAALNAGLTQWGQPQLGTIAQQADSITYTSDTACYTLTFTTEPRSRLAEATLTACK